MLILSRYLHSAKCKKDDILAVMTRVMIVNSVLLEQLMHVWLAVIIIMMIMMSN